MLLTGSPDTAKCQGRVRFPFDEEVTSLTMIAVGVGVAPMVHTLRAIFRQYDIDMAKMSGEVNNTSNSSTGSNHGSDNSAGDRVKCMQIVLLYGVVRLMIECTFCKVC